MNPTMHWYSDEYLEHWGRVFVAEDLYCRRGVRFETFLQAPQEILDAVAQLPVDAAPLLPRQAAVMAAVLWSERTGHAGHVARRELTQRALARLLDMMTALHTRAVVDVAEETEPALPAAARLAGERYIEPMRHHSFAVSGHAWDRRR